MTLRRAEAALLDRIPPPAAGQTFTRLELTADEQVVLNSLHAKGFVGIGERLTAGNLPGWAMVIRRI